MYRNPEASQFFLEEEFTKKRDVGRTNFWPLEQEDIRLVTIFGAISIISLICEIIGIGVNILFDGIGIRSGKPMCTCTWFQNEKNCIT